MSTCRRRQGEEWGGKSLLELQQPHKSRLVREQEAWAKAVSSFTPPPPNMLPASR